MQEGKQSLWTNKLTLDMIPLINMWQKLIWIKASQDRKLWLTLNVWKLKIFWAIKWDSQPIKTKMEDNIKIGTWNLCLGLANKKEIVSKMILEEGIDICCFQEIDVPLTLNHELLSFKGYALIVENNDKKARTGFCIKKCYWLLQMWWAWGNQQGAVV